MKEEKIKILGFVGPSGCGKDTAAHWLDDNYPNIYHYVKLYTTRPKRDNKDDGYKFVRSDEFLKQVLNGQMLNAQEFNGWYYGLSSMSLVKNRINVMPMNVEMVMQILEENNPKYDLKLVYIKTLNKERLLHTLQREYIPDCYEICRRYIADIDDYVNNDELHKVCNFTIFNPYDLHFYLSVEKIAATCFEGD